MLVKISNHSLQPDREYCAGSDPCTQIDPGSYECFVIPWAHIGVRVRTADLESALLHVEDIGERNAERTTLGTFDVGLNTDQTEFKRAICLVVLIECKLLDLTSIQFWPVKLESAKLRKKALKWHVNNIDLARDSVKVSPVINSSATPTSISLQRPGIPTAISFKSEPNSGIV